VKQQLSTSCAAPVSDSGNLATRVGRRSMGLYTRMPALLCLLLLTACATVSSESDGVAGPTLSPSWKRLKNAACNAVFDLQTIVPLVGYGIFQIGDFDEDVARSASEKTPIFGSRKNARLASNIGRAFLGGEAFVTSFIPREGESESLEWTLGSGVVALVSVASKTEALKTTIGRTRPDGRDDKSFPSGHTSVAASLATLSNRNLDHLRGCPILKRSAQSLNVLMAAGVGWGRVEGGRHFPSDVLFGYALGHSVSAFIHDAFLGNRAEDSFRLSIIPLKNGGMVGLSLRW